MPLPVLFVLPGAASRLEALSCSYFCAYDTLILPFIPPILSFFLYLILRNYKGVPLGHGVCPPILLLKVNTQGRKGDTTYMMAGTAPFPCCHSPMLVQDTCPADAQGLLYEL